METFDQPALSPFRPRFARLPAALPARFLAPRLLSPRFLAALCLAAMLSACGGGGGEELPELSEAERLAMAPSAANGERLFLQCAVCHERAEGAGHRVGPNLWGVVGAPAAHHEDFTYSKAMERSGLVWDEATLDAYMENPQDVVPGTRMAFPGVKSQADRRDLIAYLETLK